MGESAGILHNITALCGENGLYRQEMEGKGRCKESKTGINAGRVRIAGLDTTPDWVAMRPAAVGEIHAGGGDCKPDQPGKGIVQLPAPSPCRSSAEDTGISGENHCKGFTPRAVSSAGSPRAAAPATQAVRTVGQRNHAHMAAAAVQISMRSCTPYKKNEILEARRVEGEFCQRIQVAHRRVKALGCKAQKAVLELREGEIFSTVGIYWERL